MELSGRYYKLQHQNEHSHQLSVTPQSCTTSTHPLLVATTSPWSSSPRQSPLLARGRPFKGLPPGDPTPPRKSPVVAQTASRRPPPNLVAGRPVEPTLRIFEVKHITSFLATSPRKPLVLTRSLVSARAAVRPCCEVSVEALRAAVAIDGTS
jgi:hypothetical protein